MPKKAKSTKKSVTSKASPSEQSLESLVKNLASTVNSLTEEVKELKKDHQANVESDESHELRRQTKEQNVQKNKVKKAITKGAVENIYARYELWSYDEYNQGSILYSNNELSRVIAEARRVATESNVDNALASGEKDNAWEVYFPEVHVEGEPNYDVLYAGNKKNGTHMVNFVKDGKWQTRVLSADVGFKFYLGELSNGRNKTDWYLSDHKNKLITSFDSNLLEGKTVLFIKVLPE